MAEDESLRDREALIEEDRADERLVHVAEQALALAPAGGFFPLAQEQILSESQILPPRAQVRARDDLRLHLGQPAFVHGFESLEKPVRHDRRDDAVSEKLQALVVGDDAMLDGV